MNINKIKEDREKAERILEDIQNYLDDNYADDKLLKDYAWLKENIEDLKCEIDANKTLAEEERDIIIEKTHYEKED